jgi:hypothetical protein
VRQEPAQTLLPCLREPAVADGAGRARRRGAGAQASPHPAEQGQEELDGGDEDSGELLMLMGLRTDGVSDVDRYSGNEP